MSWTHSRDKILRQTYAAGESLKVISDAVDKSTGAVRGRIRTLGLKRIRPDLWSAEKDAVVREQWGVKRAREIGRLIGMTKSAVLGRASRLGLRQLKPGRPRTQTSRLPKRNRAPISQKSTSRPKLAINDNVGCQWLDGEPRERRFCGRPRRDQSSYCDDHHQRCWIKHEDYRSEAA